MEPVHLARAVVHWLEYQSLCGRSELFCEAYLAQPIGEYCLSITPEHFEPEFAYPPIYQRGTTHPRLMDFAVFNRTQGAAQMHLSHAIETKFITAKRDYKQEIFDDLYRLLWFQPTREPALCRRWLLVAGYRRNVHSRKFLEATVQEGRGRNRPTLVAFRGLLSSDLNNHSRTKPVHTIDNRIRSCWVKAAQAFGESQLPAEVSVRLIGRAPAIAHQGGACCYIWEIQRPQPNFPAVHPINNNVAQALV